MVNNVILQQVCLYVSDIIYFITNILFIYFHLFILGQNGYYEMGHYVHINYLETKCHIYIRMTKTGLTPYATDADYNGDNKCRCKYCDKIIKNQDRLLAHERTCEITTFNILYKLQNGTLPKRPFTNTIKVITTNGDKPMNQIDIYEEFKTSRQ